MTRLVAIWSPTVDGVCHRGNQLGIAHRLVSVVRDNETAGGAFWAFYQLDESMFSRVVATPGLTWR